MGSPKIISTTITAQNPPSSQTTSNKNEPEKIIGDINWKFVSVFNEMMEQFEVDVDNGGHDGIRDPQLEKVVVAVRWRVAFVLAGCVDSLLALIPLNGDARGDDAENDADGAETPPKQRQDGRRISLGRRQFVEEFEALLHLIGENIMVD